MPVSHPGSATLSVAGAVLALLLASPLALGGCDVDDDDTASADDDDGSNGGCWVHTSILDSYLHRYDAEGTLLETVNTAELVGQGVRVSEYNPRDGSFWLVDGGKAWHVNGDLEVDGSLDTGTGVAPWGLHQGTDIYLADGSLFVAETASSRILRIAPTGEVLMEVDAYQSLGYLAVDQADGSVWFNYREDWIDHVGKLDPDGNLVVSIAADAGGYMFPFAMSVSPVDSSVWFQCECYQCTGHDNGHLVGLDPGGTERLALPLGDLNGHAYVWVFVDVAGDLWFNDVQNDEFVKLSPAGDELARLPLDAVQDFSPVPDGSAIWLRSVYTEGGKVRKITPDGTELLFVDVGNEAVWGVHAIP